MTDKMRSTLIDAHLHFILKSIDANKGMGSSAFYSRLRHPVGGWAEAYPETTGYIIPTLLQAEKQLGISLKSYVQSCIYWLSEEVQMSSGAFPSLYSGNEKESLFNSAQIALGFLAYTEHFPSDEKILLSELDLLNWFVENVDKVDADIHYKKDFVPSYYTRVVWPCLLLAKKYKHRVLKDKAFHLLDVIINRSLGEGDFPRDAGFSGDKAFSHTIAYTIRGLLEINELYPNEEREEILNRLVQGQMKAIDEAGGKMAGSYDLNWKGDYSFRCLTGEYQWAIIFLRMYGREGEQVFLQYAERLLEEDFSSNILFPIGAVYGSKPFWKSYMRFKAPNWAAKFGLDALLLHKKLQDDKA